MQGLRENEQSVSASIKTSRKCFSESPAPCVLLLSDSRLGKDASEEGTNLYDDPLALVRYLRARHRQHVSIRLRCPIISIITTGTGISTRARY